MCSSLAMTACAYLLLGGYSRPVEDSANSLLGKDAECLELFTRNDTLHCDIHEDGRKPQAKSTPRWHAGYEVVDAVYLLKATGGRCTIDTTYITKCSTKTG